MKAVLISIKPKWCELIASGKKTLEVRKTRPKLETPFKCYIYCTKPKKILRYVWGKKDYAGWGEPYTQMRDDEKVFCKIPDGSSPFCSPPYSGKVIGEFVCDRIDYVRNYGDCVDAYDCDASCLSAAEIINYAKDKDGKFVYTYGWHISELKIYDEPKELTEFRKPCLHEWDDTTCYTCKRSIYKAGEVILGYFDKLTRPPQSWCYVEEVDA